MKPRHQLILYSILLVLAVSMMVILYNYTKRQANKGFIQPRDYLEIVKDGRIRVLSSYDALGTTAQNGELQGFIYSLAQSLSKRSGIPVDVVLEDDANQTLSMLERGEVDLVATDMVRTIEIDTTKFVWLMGKTSGPIRLVQPSDTFKLIKRQLDLGGRTITLPRQSPLELFIRILSDEIGDSIAVQIDPLYNTEQIIMKVSAGKSDLTLCSDVEAKRYAPHFPNLDFSLPITHSLRRGWLVRRTAPQFTDSLNRWLDDIGIDRY